MPPGCDLDLQSAADRGILASMDSLLTRQPPPFSLLTRQPPPLTPAAIAFYATAATVIPVLYLALAIQGRTWQDLVRSFFQVTERMWRWSLGIAGLLVILAGFVGEFAAFDALFNGRSDYGQARTVFLAVLVLTFGVAAIPAGQFFYVMALRALSPPASVERSAPPRTGQTDDTDENGTTP